MQSREHRRAQLLTWIAETRRNQRRLAVGLAIATALAIALTVWRPNVGEATLAVVALTAFCGFWITGSHITDWQSRLEELRSSEDAKHRQRPD